MKLVHFILPILSIFLAALSAKAEMISYVDEDGEMHYVNTDFAKVPGKYRQQIEGDTAADNSTLNKKVAAPQSEELATVSKNKEPSVEILVSLDCPDCHKLAILLKAHKIKYLRYDVDQHPYGKELYAKIGGNLPITKIGDEIIYGPDITKIASLLRKNKATENISSAPSSSETSEPKGDTTP